MAAHQRRARPRGRRGDAAASRTAEGTRGPRPWPRSRDGAPPPVGLGAPRGRVSWPRPSSTGSTGARRWNSRQAAQALGQGARLGRSRRGSSWSSRSPSSPLTWPSAATWRQADIGVIVVVIVLATPGLAVGYANGLVAHVGQTGSAARTSKDKQDIAAADKEVDRPIPNKPMNIRYSVDTSGRSLGARTRSSSCAWDRRPKASRCSRCPRDLQVDIPASASRR